MPRRFDDDEYESDSRGGPRRRGQSRRGGRNEFQDGAFGGPSEVPAFLNIPAAPVAPEPPRYQQEHAPRRPARPAREVVTSGLGPETGTVKFYNVEKGYGFITPASADGDLFVHITVLRNSGVETLVQHAKVTFERGPGRQPGKEAVVRLISVD